MRQLLHACWPLMAVLAFTAFLALQIPRKALFFAPVETPRVEPFASFVVFDPATAATVMQKVRMSWQMRGQGDGALTEVPLGVLDQIAEVPPPEPLALPPAFFVAPGVPSVAPRATDALLPPTLAVPREARAWPPPEDVNGPRLLRERLLALPESLRVQDE